MMELHNMLGQTLLRSDGRQVFNLSGQVIGYIDGGQLVALSGGVLLDGIAAHGLALAGDDVLDRRGRKVAIVTGGTAEQKQGLALGFVAFCGDGA